VLQLERWGRRTRHWPGLEAGEARQIAAELIDAVLPMPWRLEGLSDLVAIARRKYGVTARERIDWVREQIRLMKDNPRHFPRERPEIRDRTRRERILAIVRAAPDQRVSIAYLMRKTRWTRDAVANLTRRLCDPSEDGGDAELLRLSPGVFTLPGLGEQHVPAAKAVLTWFESQPPETEVKALQLAEAIGRTRQAVDSALHGNGALIKNGQVICVRRGVFKMAPWRACGAGRLAG
jgi:hypothetical protein